MPKNDDLNFMPPTPPAFAAEVPATTDIISFVNNNPWPVHVSNNMLGISLTLSNKGDVIRQPGTAKVVNDPRFLCFVGPGQLTVTRGVEQRPVVTYRDSTDLAPASAASSPFPQGFAGDARRLPTHQTAPAAHTPQPVSSSSVRTFSTREEAVRAGIIDGKIVELVEGVPDNDGTPPQNAPEIRVPSYKSPTPTQAREFASQQIDSPEQAPLVQEILSAAERDPMEDPVKQAIRLTTTKPAEAPAPIPMPPPPATVELPNAEPRIDEVVDAPSEPVSESKQDRFLDPKSGKRFKYRSLLARYVKTHYPPDKQEEILSLYPTAKS